MAEICIYLTLDPYLAQWFIHSCGGTEPCTLIKGSVESKILEVFLRRMPEGSTPETAQGNGVAVKIPEFRNLPPEYFNYLPKAAKRMLVDCIRKRFDVELWEDLHHFGAICRTRQDDLIYAWMDNHGIQATETNWNVIAKRYQRQRKIYYNRKYRRQKSS